MIHLRYRVSCLSTCIQVFGDTLQKVDGSSLLLLQILNLAALSKTLIFMYNIYGIWFIVMLIATITFIVVSLVVINEMSVQRGRSSATWIILSFIISPFIVMFYLLCLGETDEKRRERLIKDDDYLRTWKDDD